MKFAKSLIIGAVALASVLTPALGLSSAAYAEEAVTETPATKSWLQVSPVSSRVVLKPGTSLDYSMIVTNIGTDKFNYSVYSAPYSIVDEAYNVSFSNETNRTQLARWIKFINDDGSLTDKYTGTIEPGVKKTINYRITVPADVPAGGQYATVFAQTEQSPEEAANVSGITTVSRIGLVVYGRTDGDTNDSAEIVDFNIPGFMTHGPITATSLVKNSGNTDFEASYEFTVRSIFGSELYTDTDVHNVLPDTSRRKNFEWENTSAMGIFRVTYKVTALEQTMEKTKLVIILPVYMIIIMLILLTILIVWIIMLVRKRRERKSRLIA